MGKEFCDNDVPDSAYNLQHAIQHETAEQLSAGRSCLTLHKAAMRYQTML